MTLAKLALASLTPTGLIGSQVLVAAPLVALCFACGLIVTFSPQIGTALVLAVAVASTFLLGVSPTRVFLAALVVLLAGYLLLGRGFAYLGLGPFFIGELVLALAAIQLLVAIWTARIQPLHWMLLGFMLIGLVRTVPFIGVHGIDALRDSVIWAYGLFALAVSLTVRPSHFGWIYATLNHWMPTLVLVAGGLYALQFLLGNSLPKAPGSDLTIPSIRPGEIAVHLAGMSAFIMLGLYRSEKSKRGWGDLSMLAVIAVGLLFVSALSRGAFLAITVSLFVAFLIRPSGAVVRSLAVLLVISPFVFLLLPDISAGGREFTPDQISSNVTSIIQPEEGTILAGTRSFRENWWSEIFSYTFGGAYFLGGKGFGINLADADGFQVEEDGSLRSPHNGHMTVLARMGVPAFVLWLAFIGVYLLTLLQARTVFLRRGQTVFGGLAAWILVYSIAALVNMSFDVYLEGPQGGIWFWSLIGLGIGLAAIAFAGRIGGDVLDPEASAGASDGIRGHGHAVARR